MNPLLLDIAKEIMIAGLTAAFTWVCQYVIRLAKDLNQSFVKIRCMQARLEEVERHLGLDDDDCYSNQRGDP